MRKAQIDIDPQEETLAGLSVTSRQGNGIPPSGIREIIQLALTMPGCIRLEVGEPDFETPMHIVEAASEMIRRGRVRYVASAGVASLREKIVAKVETTNHITANAECAVVTPGGVGGVAATLGALVRPGDEVMIPDPAWPNYGMIVALLKGRCVPYPCRASNNFLPDPDEIASRLTDRTRVLVINSPANPTGAVFPRSLVEMILTLAQRANVYLLSDECYDEIVFDGEHVSPAAIDNADGRIVSVYTFSKTYAMTGWRVGYVVASAPIALRIARVIEATQSCVSPVSQAAAEAALDGAGDSVAAMVAAYHRRRDVCVDLLRGADLLSGRPSGAFYVMADVSSSGTDSRTFALALLRDHGVAVAPGTAFGDIAKHSVRLSLASSESQLRAGVARLRCALEASGRE